MSEGFPITAGAVVTKQSRAGLTAKRAWNKV